MVGQKAYNGVAVLARVPFEVTHRARCRAWRPTTRRRATSRCAADGVALAGIYLPNGNSGGEAGFAYKLRWMEALRERAAALLEADDAVR